MTVIASIDEIVSDWEKRYRFIAMKDTNEIYYYEDGVYKSNGEKFVEILAESELTGAKNHIISEIVGKIRRRNYVDRDEINGKSHILNFQNGLYNLETGELMDHTPNHYSTVQLPVKYDSSANCTKITKFLGEIVTPKNIPLLEEVAGWTLWRDYVPHKAIMLLGGGRNGKSTYVYLIERLLGEQNVSNVSLQDLTNDRFASARLFGKAANIYADLPDKDLLDTDAFKIATGQDFMEAQEKFRQRFKFKNTAKLIYSANKLPMCRDDSRAFYARWVLIEFPFTFDTPERPANSDLRDELTTAEEMSGFLNLALDGLNRLRSNGWKFSYTMTAEDIEERYKRLSNPVYAFIMDRCEADPDGFEPKQKLYGAFKEYAAENNLRPVTEKKFGELLLAQYEIPVTSVRPTSSYSGIRTYSWMGIKLRDDVQYVHRSNINTQKSENDLGSKMVRKLDILDRFVEDDEFVWEGAL
ncbi:MAG: phage/plasmid primase, P4 family [Methanothrix sp.]|jgi:putative DNA primase/helicase|nr:hypothetical protein [Methanothrix harundinacea]MDD3709452.1 phage/plasmid primase, P4 family [Methanothrix sp.]